MLTAKYNMTPTKLPSRIVSSPVIYQLTFMYVGNDSSGAYHYEKS